MSISKGVKIRLKSSNISFREVSATEIKSLMLNYHYLHRQVATKFAYGLYNNDQLMGMVTYSGVRNSLAGSISDQANKGNTLELSRLFIKDEISQNIPNITSEFVGWSLRQLKQHGNWYIISFADSGMNHVGAIYQATNFIYCGTTNPGIFCYNGPDRKGGQWKAGHHYRFFLLRTIKYRYIKFIGSKTFKKQARKTLKFEIKPYPKQDTKHYHMGDTEERLIKDRKTGKIYPENELLARFPDYDWNDEEKWKNFYDYSISSFGRVYSKKTNKLLSPFKHNYYYIDLTIKGQVKKYSIHRLVAMMFIPNPDNLPYVNHIDENPYNDQANNLEWCTAKYNTNYGGAKNRISNTKYVRGETIPIYVISTKSGNVYFFKSIKRASKVLNVGERNLRRCLLNHKGSLKEYIFCKKEEYSKELSDNLIKQALKSYKYKRDYIVDNHWFVGSRDTRNYLGISKSQLYRAIKNSPTQVDEHTFKVPSKEEVREHFLEIESHSDIINYKASFKEE